MLSLILVVTVLTALYLWYKKHFNYWTNKGVACVFPASILENFMIIRSKSFSESMEDLHLGGPSGRYMGVFQFGMPMLLLKDPNLLKRITIKDFDHFVDHRTFAPEEVDPLWGRNLMANKGDKWKKARTIISPVFTSNKLRAMFVLMEECAQQFVNFISDKTESVTEMEMKDIFSRYSNDVIATTAFGLKCDSLKTPNNQFYLSGKEASDAGNGHIWRLFIHSMCPFLAKLFRIRIFSEDLYTYFTSVIRETVVTREQRKIVRPDLINILMENRKEQHMPIDDQTLSEMVSYAFLFYFAGFETVSTAMTFLAYELVVNPDVQERLRDEIDQVAKECDGKVTYEALLNMKYMDMVVSESLRKWPSTPVQDRLCTKRYTIQPESPGEEPLTLEKGDMCMFSIFGIHRDPKYYPNPTKFDPERFNEENKKNINVSTYIPFGIGPRICIGSRFALLEMKILLLYILTNFEIVSTSRTQIPVVLSKQTFNLEGHGGIYLGFKKRIETRR